MYAYECVSVYSIVHNKCVCARVYIYIYMEKTKEFNVKESRGYNVLVLTNHHQDSEKMISSVVRSPMDV